MMRRWYLLVAAVLWLALVPPLVAARAAGADRGVDLRLLLAVDASASIDAGNLARQLNGHAAAFRDPRVQQALASGKVGAIAVALMLWSGPEQQWLAVPWRRLANPADARAFADAIDALPLAEMGGATAMGAALDAAGGYLATVPYDAPRSVIDLSSNGFSNAGLAPEAIRDRLARSGVEVNALAILDEYPWLESYFSESVITGTAPFVMAVGSRDDYARALLRKLIREISGLDVAGQEVTAWAR